MAAKSSHELQDDFERIDEMDPSLSEGHRLIYARQVPFELRTADTSTAVHDVGTTESILVKVLTLDDVDLRIELTSESDLFFHYSCSVSDSSFARLADDQKFLIDYPEFPAVLVRMLNRCIRVPQVFFAVLVLQPNGAAVVEFLQNNEHKFLDLLVLPFAESPEYIIRQQISYRYNALKARLAILQSRLPEVTARPRSDAAAGSTRRVRCR